MADVSDVIAAIADRAAAALYPDGDQCPSAVGIPVRISEGWPLPEALNLALSTKDPGIQVGAWVSVYPVPNVTQVTSPAVTGWQARDLPPATLAVAVNNETGLVTLSGAGSKTLPQVVMLIIGEQSYPAPVGPDDTAEGIAQALYTAVVHDHPDVTVSGATLTVPSGGTLIGRIGRKGVLMKGLERERQAVMVTVWAPDGAARARIGACVRSALADVPRIPLPDGSSGLLTYRQTNDSDGLEKVRIYKRDIHYWAEFSTYLEVAAYEVTDPRVTISPLP